MSAKLYIDTPLSFNSLSLKVASNLITDSPYYSLTRGDAHQPGEQTLPECSQAFLPGYGVQGMPQTAILCRPRRSFLRHQPRLHGQQHISGAHLTRKDLVLTCNMTVGRYYLCVQLSCVLHMSEHVIHQPTCLPHQAAHIQQLQ